MTTVAQACILSGGFGHPFDETTAILQAQAEAAGWAVECETDLDRLIVQLEALQLVVVNALRWTMTQHEKYAPHRSQWAYSASMDQIAALDRFVSAGGRLLVMHTGTICWDNQPLWPKIMGGGWQWGRSHHPPLGEVNVDLTDEGRIFAPDCKSHFALIDEGYRHLAPAADCRILATAQGDEGDQPIVWIRSHGQGKVAVDALGHDARSLNANDHSRLLAALLNWLREDAAHAIMQ